MLSYTNTKNYKNTEDYYNSDLRMNLVKVENYSPDQIEQLDSYLDGKSTFSTINSSGVGIKKHFLECYQGGGYGIEDLKEINVSNFKGVDKYMGFVLMQGQSYPGQLVVHITAKKDSNYFLLTKIIDYRANVNVDMIIQECGSKDNLVQLTESCLYKFIVDNYSKDIEYGAKELIDCFRLV
jgi:hypothetical protein